MKTRRAGNCGESLDPFMSGEHVDGCERTGEERLVDIHERVYRGQFNASECV